MNKKTMLIGLGVLAVAGIGYYMWKKKSETTSGACGCSGADGSDEEDSSSNATAGDKPRGTPCPSGYHYDNGYCKKNVSPHFTGDAELPHTYVAGWENEPTSDYTAGWDKYGNPRACSFGYNATLDPQKGTICTHAFVKKRGALTA
jgi:hypothetical protein